MFRHDQEVDFTDLFCGLGGSTRGLIEAGLRLRLAMNHDRVQVAAHRANHPDAEHLTEDINAFDKRSLPRTRVLWGSPICTEISPAGGRKRTRGQIALLDQGGNPIEGEGQPEFQRTRATALDIIAATEVHRYDVVLCENVPEFFLDWELFDWWIGGFRILGYNHQIVCASSAHLGDDDNELAPQHRNRGYVVFTREGIPLPDLEVRPAAVCPTCGPVRARQVWRNPRRRKMGSWGVQYDYRCPTPSCGLILDPTVRPVSDVIDWSAPGTRIGDGRPDRKKFTPYADSTRTRVAAGLAKFGHEPHVTMLRRNTTAVAIGGPVPAVSAQGKHHALIVPNGRRGAVRTTAEPLTTVACKPHHSLVRPAPEVDDCTLRMLSPRELARAQRFPADYILPDSTQEAQILGVGNAVSVNAARWLGERILAVL
ncbi:MULTISPECIES: DNA cytosine methyltransferase [unclassified Streptomyces]|uniref:DNA cytosine methyltransferase n=1 Tax=unclassified Streptomyces TaxID=2593676 RepID=UPI0035DCD0C4